MKYIRLYTRNRDGIKYPEELAYSVHMSAGDGVTMEPLNKNYGILFPEAAVADNNTIIPKTVMNPTVTKKDGAYIIFARDTKDDTILYTWITFNFVDFEGPFVKSPDDIKDLLRNSTDTVEISDEEYSLIKTVWMPRTVKVEKTRFKFPLAEGFADPQVFRWGGKWYFIATNDINHNIGLYVREADSVDCLFTDRHSTSVILDYDEANGFIQCFWAPEFHVIGGRLYILFAVSGKEWRVVCHYMRLREGGDIMNPRDWERPVKMFDCPGITLDMTHFTANNADYVVWSERYRIGTPLDSGSMLYIAKIDPEEPSKLLSEPVLLSRPLYGWENQSNTINNEGPYPLILGNRIYLAYSGGAAAGYSYVVGYLTADVDADLLDPKSWRKTPAPVLSSYATDKEQGPGHCSFFTENGDIYVSYHAERPGEDGRRNTAIRKVYINELGFPLLNVIEEEAEN